MGRRPVHRFTGQNSIFLIDKYLILSELHAYMRESWFLSLFGLRQNAPTPEPLACQVTGSGAGEHSSERQHACRAQRKARPNGRALLPLASQDVFVAVV